MNTTFGILGNNLKLSTSFVEKIILHTNALIDQEHIKMNIIVDNNLFNINNEDLLKLLNSIKKSQVDYLILTFNNENIYEFINKNTNISIINKTFNENDMNLIKKIISLAKKEYKK